ncbi:exodeoxyribonuclease III [Corynebacterium endometrii]|uniref:exodeoxyribonuclease III n=1 Tax=Corynebacterium endometrii TaxID=2488819 RepID=UPI003CCC50BC
MWRKHPDVDAWECQVAEVAAGGAAAEKVALARGLAPFVNEGRYIEIDLPGLTLANLYLPKGGLPAELQIPGRMRDKPDGGAKYERKQKFLASFARQLARTRKAAKSKGNEFLLMGDLNVAHQNFDVTNWRSNGKTDGFLPEEREWFGEQVSPRTLVDVVRRLHGDKPGPNSWWSWAGQAYSKDVGWRIDYHLASPGLARAARSYRVDSEWDVDGVATRMSDHAAVVVEYAV